MGFGEGFRWGVATAAYQIEGAAAEDGRGPSIWDTFSHTPGKTANGDTGDVACDHYHRWPEDLDLVAGLGAGTSYRFSIAWPRIQPTGAGPADPAGLDFYDRLVDGMLARGIAPVPTLYHWDLPQPLEDAGGWTVRATAERFAEYAGLVADRLGDRASAWVTQNEPVVTAFYGYALGLMAPGRTMLTDVFPVVHHLLLSHGLAAQVLPGTVGLAQNLGLGKPVTDSPEDVRAAELLTDLHDHLYCDPVLLGRYPDNLDELLPTGHEVVRDGDLALISARHDYLGVNYYSPQYVRAPSPGNPLPFDLAEPPAGLERVGMGWPVEPAGFTSLLVHLRDRYGDRLPPVWITENGRPTVDEPGPDGAVDDQDRIAYLSSHLAAVSDAVDQGVDVRGYFTWSLLDNFEWAFGYDERFGLVRVDYPTQRRTPKASYGWYRDLITGARRGSAGGA